MARTRGARAWDHDAKKADLVDRLTQRLGAVELGRPSLRQLAEAAGVSMPTLRHYFGDRDGVVRAALEQAQARGAVHLEIVSRATGPLRQSLLDFAAHLIGGFEQQGLSRLFAIGLTEGTGHEQTGPIFVRTILEPTVDALTRRLGEHVARGEFPDGDLRGAALRLVSMLAFACEHQFNLGGCRTYPLDLRAYAEQSVDLFIRGHGLTPSDQKTR